MEYKSPEDKVAKSFNQNLFVQSVGQENFMNEVDLYDSKSKL